MNESLAGDAQKAFAAMSLASKVSRRDTTAQVWLLERAAADNDFEAILRHYDAAMSVTPELGPVLQPVMVDALQYQDVRDAMVGYVNRQARWMPGFLNLASREAALEDVIDLTAPIAVALSAEEYEKSIARIIYRAAQDGDWEGAMDYAEAVWADFEDAYNRRHLGTLLESTQSQQSNSSISSNNPRNLLLTAQASVRRQSLRARQMIQAVLVSDEIVEADRIHDDCDDDNMIFPSNVEQMEMMEEMLEEKEEEVRIMEERYRRRERVWMVAVTILVLAVIALIVTMVIINR